VIDFGATLAECVQDVVRRFGPRFRPDYQIQPILFGGKIPETVVVANAIFVRLSETARSSLPQAQYQISHEAVHCVLASGRRDTIFFEEGLAISYSLDAGRISRKLRRTNEASLPKLYKEVLSVFRSINPTDEAVRALRAECPDIDQLQPDLVHRVLQVDPQRAAATCRRMPLER
jgi:hypothetical protein